MLTLKNDIDDTIHNYSIHRSIWILVYASLRIESTVRQVSNFTEDTIMREMGGYE